jgi:hypothetical protein
MQHVCTSIAASWLCLAIPMALLALNALRFKNCDPGGGLLYMLLGPVISTALAATAGVVIAHLTSRRGWATAGALLLPLLEIARNLYGFYTTPAIFAYGHFFGYFPGTLYDTQLKLPAAFVSFRLVTLALWVMCCAVLIALHDSSDLRLRWSALKTSGERRGWLALAGALGLAVFAAELHAPQLGHRTHAAWIAENLGGRIDGPCCTLLFPRELDRDDAQRLHVDCQFRVTQMERVLGVRQLRPITAYLFRSSDEKRALMGAGNIYIAKPWRNEVYLQVQSWPHPVFAHEIAHVVAGNYGVGPFRVAGRLGGLWPNPALIEGVAVAAAWSVHDGLTPHQWARAMLEQQMAPSLSAITGAAFLAQPKGQAYTLSGSFVRYVLDTYGNRAVRRLYMTSDAATAVGKPLEPLEREWHTFLKPTPLPDAVRAAAGD